MSSLRKKHAPLCFAMHSGVGPFPHRRIVSLEFMLTQLPFRPTQAKARGWNLLLAGFAAACVIIVLALQTVSAQNSPVSLALLTIVISGFAGVWQFRKYGFDPLALFCWSFALYDGLLLFRLCLVSNSSVLLYPTSFGYETYAAAGGMCVIAAAAVLITTFLWELMGARSDRNPFRPPKATASTAWFWAGGFCYVAGIL